MRRPRIPNFRWLIVIVLSVACGLSFFDRQVLSVLAPKIISDLGTNDVGYSWVVFAFILGYSVMFSVGGWLIDRIGTRRGLALFVGIWSLASLLHALAHNAFELGAFRFLLGVGEGGCFPGAAKGVVEWFSRKDRAVAMGIATVGGSAIGAVVAPPIVVWTAIHTGWRGAFLITGVIGAAWLLVWLFFYSRPEESRFVLESERKWILEDRLPKVTDPHNSLAQYRWKDLIGIREVRYLVISRFFFDPVFYFYMFWIPQYLHQARGASLVTIGQLTWIPFLVLGITSVIGGWVSDQMVRRGATINRARKTLLVAAAVVAPLSILVISVNSIGAAIGMICIFMLAHGFWITNYMTMIGDLFPAHVASVVGLTGTAGGVGGFLSSVVIGHVVQSFSFLPVFVAAGMMYPVCAAILLLGIRKIHPLDRVASAGGIVSA